MELVAYWIIGMRRGEKSHEWREILKIGRTHLADATPLTLGQEISGLARQVGLSVERCATTVETVLELSVGGTAVGTGINTHAEFGSRVCEILSTETGIPFEEAENHFEANSQRGQRLAWPGVVFGVDHTNRVAPREFRVKGAAVGTRHRKAFFKSKGLLIKSHGRIGILLVHCDNRLPLNGKGNRVSSF
jgi:hypothetical protein